MFGSVNLRRNIGPCSWQYSWQAQPSQLIVLYYCIIALFGRFDSPHVFGCVSMSWNVALG